ncbi:MAG: glycosyltransferase involved in cell wall biosynthesis [Methylophilaceae bacterium]|jgi:glycosyltransferase involved in cell wall biosynthesis
MARYSTFLTLFFWLLRKVSQKLIFELDDAIFNNTDSRDSETRLSRFITTASQCDHVFARNQYLTDTAKMYKSNASVIPTSLNTEKYNRPVERYTKDFVLVWIGSRSTKKYIGSILQTIKLASKTIPHLRLKIVAEFNL